MNIYENLDLVSVGDEIWKDVCWVDEKGLHDYIGLYQVSNMGRVKILNYKYTKKQKIKKQKIKKQTCIKGYSHVNIYRNGMAKMVRINRLVAFHFCEGYFEGAVCDHINTIKKDNRADNLRWCTQRENISNQLTLKHMSESLRGRNFTNEWKDNISKARIGKFTGENASMYGRQHTEETKKMISEKHYKRKMIICDDVIFKSIKSCSEYYGIDASTIAWWLRNDKVPNEWNIRGLSYYVESEVA